MLLCSRGIRQRFPNYSDGKHLGVMKRLIGNLEYKISMLINLYYIRLKALTFQLLISRKEGPS
jgi:hypothetical protein